MQIGPFMGACESAVISLHSQPSQPGVSRRVPDLKLKRRNKAARLLFNAAHFSQLGKYLAQNWKFEIILFTSKQASGLFCVQANTLTDEK